MKNSKSANKEKVEGQWVEGSVQDFLELSAADMELIETRLFARSQVKLGNASSCKVDLRNLAIHPSSRSQN